MDRRKFTLICIIIKLLVIAFFASIFVWCILMEFFPITNFNQDHNLSSFENLKKYKRYASPSRHCLAEPPVGFSEEPINTLSHVTARNNNLPSMFDTRKNWPKCQNITNWTPDQGNCGSCWAYASVGAIAARTCISQELSDISQLPSPEYALRCIRKCGSCRGGSAYCVLEEWLTIGLLDGKCVADPGDDIRRLSPDFVTPKCIYDPKCRRDHTGHNISIYYNDSINVMNNIFNYGPCIGFMMVREDFAFDFAETSNDWVYYPETNSRKIGGHFVRIIGWDEEGLTKRWLILNTWGKDWAENGLFRIEIGKNICGIESVIYCPII